MTTYEFARYLMNALEHDLVRFKDHRNDLNRGSAVTRLRTLKQAVRCWVKFPLSLQSEARALIRYAEAGLNNE